MINCCSCLTDVHYCCLNQLLFTINCLVSSMFMFLFVQRCLCSCLFSSVFMFCLFNILFLFCLFSSMSMLMFVQLNMFLFVQLNVHVSVCSVSSRKTILATIDQLETGNRSDNLHCFNKYIYIIKYRFMFKVF